jgi:type I restriction enzyme R subunit
MSTQPEQVLEDNLIEQLVKLGHAIVKIEDENGLLSNLKTQLEKHNNIQLTNGEFAKMLNHLNKGNVFERSKILRDKFQLTRDNGESIYIEFINQDHWCQNQFQVTRQITIEGSYKNRYDVTILINGLPLVQIELKRRGLELKEAFNQINRYHRHSFGASNGLFLYVQVFIISNGVNTKYYANNYNQSFKQTFYWSDKDNHTITQLDQFTRAFLEPCHISKMICKYIVLAEVTKSLMILRPYQYYATEAIIEQVRKTNDNGYIWHTTGSGKTLTSFKTSQILTKLPMVHKVVFVVDRKDLDYQTAKEFNSFAKGSIDSTDNTSMLVKQLSNDTPLIVTTIQKLNHAISKAKHTDKIAHMKTEKVVFIFDECHRSQFGETHKNIKSFFGNNQMFGFTGTPIFADNAGSNELGKRTTKDLFNECLHRYVITDAIRDENVLKFSVEYVGRYKQKEDSRTEIDIEVEDIDRKELMESPVRLEKITDYILAHHDRKTHSRAYTAIFCVSSVEVLTKYYELLKDKREAGQHHLKVATIFSYTANEDDKNANGFLPDELGATESQNNVNSHTRDKLESYIADYNKLFNTGFSTRDSQSFYNYYNDIATRVKNREVDILLVVNMFLTGFDSKTLNTLYVDKNLKYHGLIQAYSRTNRILTEQKSQGNIVCFRNLKKATDDALALFANPNAKEQIFLHPYEYYVAKFNEAFDNLLDIAPTVDSVNDLHTEDAKLEFVTAFRELMRLRNVLISFSDFSFDDLKMDAQEFEDYKSKYLDLYQSTTGGGKEKVSILNDVDFELELIHRDEINVTYIIKLLARLVNATGDEYDDRKKEISNLLGGEATLRSKKELIERFINENLPHIESRDDVQDEFEKFWNEEQAKAFEQICQEEELHQDRFQRVIEDYLYHQREPLRDVIMTTRKGAQPGILQRKTVAERIVLKLKDFVETFINGFGG